MAKEQDKRLLTLERIKGWQDVIDYLENEMDTVQERSAGEPKLKAHFNAMEKVILRTVVNALKEGKEAHLAKADKTEVPLGVLEETIQERIRQDREHKLDSPDREKELQDFTSLLSLKLGVYRGEGLFNKYPDNFNRLIPQLAKELVKQLLAYLPDEEEIKNQLTFELGEVARQATKKVVLEAKREERERIMAWGMEDCPHAGYVNENAVLHKKDCYVCWKALGGKK